MTEGSTVTRDAWVDGHVPVLPHVTSLLAPMHVLSAVQAPKVVHVESPWFTTNYNGFKVPTSVRSVKIAVLHVDVLAALAQNPKVTHLVADEIVGGPEPMEVVTLEFRQGHPVWLLLAHADIAIRAPLSKRLVVHLVHIIDVRVAVKELTKALVAIAAACASTRSNPRLSAAGSGHVATPSLPVDVILKESMSLGFKRSFEEMLDALASQQIVGGVWDWCEVQ
ncbi:hypothetical protein GGF32_004203 [Allomyces javanicus]|nr:hypothetical protein GGF32_004203 [Allomyces javanicus]